MRVAALILVSLTAAACGSATASLVDADDHGHTIIFEGEALRSELLHSPVHEMDEDFDRLGLVFDALLDTNVEFSVSADGRTWSEFMPATIHHVEREDVVSTIGEIRAPGTSRYFRLRAGGVVLPNYLRVELMRGMPAAEAQDPVQESLEGDDVMTNETQSLKSALVVSGVTVNARSAWGGGPVTCSSRHTPYRFAVHHTDTPSSDSLSPEARLRQIQAYHRKNNGWCDIGYQFLVSRDGRLWEGRGVSYIGAHVYSQNTGNVAISFLGSYGTTAAPEAMINSAARLFGAMAKTYGVTLSTSTLKGHRFWYNNSSCPGNALAAQIPTIIARAKSGVSSVTLTGKVVTADLLAGPIAGATVQVGDKTAISDATGSFSIPSVAIGSVTVTASAAGYAPQTATVNATLNGATVKLSLTNLTVGVLRGRAYHASNPLLSVPGAKVDVAGKSAVTSEFGDFELPAVPAGTHRLSVSASGFTPYTQDIVVDAGVLDLSFALEPAATLPTGNATLTGVIYRGSNTANRIAGATVTLSDGRTATADAGGVYTFTQLPPATFVITASKVGIGTNSVQRTLANGTTTWGSVSLP